MQQSSSKRFSGIFVSYRRDDSSGHAGRLFDKLVAHFGESQIFMDIDTLEPGEDFVTVIENAVGSCEILIAIIGRHWLSSADETPRRLDNPNDFVRLEITTALSRDIRVIPVLVQRATMPKPQDLPSELAALSRRSAVELSDLRWHHDVAQLLGALQRILDERRESRRRLEQEKEDRRRGEEEAQRQRLELQQEEESRREAEQNERHRRQEARAKDLQEKAAVEQAARLHADEQARLIVEQETLMSVAQELSRRRSELDAAREKMEQTSAETHQEKRIRVEIESLKLAEDKQRRRIEKELQRRIEEHPGLKVEVVMPQMGEKITEGTITKWFKRVGERVERDEPLFEISTDKVDAEIPSPAAGVLSEIRFQEGNTVEINTTVAVLKETSLEQVEIVMPQMGESISEGTITKWLKQVGQKVERDEPLFEISTEKVDAEIPSPAAGVLSEIRFKEGDTVEVNTTVAVLKK